MENLFGANLSDVSQLALNSLKATILAPFVSGSGFYWPFLLSSLLIALLVYGTRQRARIASVADGIRAGLSPHIWGSESARIEYSYYIINRALFAVLVLPLIASSAAVGLWMSQTLSAVFGPLESPLFGPVAMKMACTIVFFVGYDLGHFLSHYVQHRFPLLWEFHKVHHSAEVLTPFTAARLHPVDLVLTVVGRNVGAGLGIGVVYYLGAGQVSTYTLFGMTALSAIYQMVGHLRHSMLWVSYGPLNGLLISPAHHQIHHSALPEHRNKNLGFALTIWDRLLGSFYAPKEKISFPMGIGDGSDGNWHRIGRMYWWPVVNVMRLLQGRDAIGIKRT